MTFLLVGMLAMTGCGDSSSQDVGRRLTPETQNLLECLHQIPQQGFMFGHHDDTLYGIGWDGDEGRSDVKSVCGEYPAVISFDLGEIELETGRSIDKVIFQKIRAEIIHQFERGGMVSLSWHVRNPKTGGVAWDVSDSLVVRSILKGGDHHAKFEGWLKKVAQFINSLQTEDGVKVPVLFRPWHEHTGSWFWWGEKHCTPEEYKQLWRMTYEVLTQEGVDNALYAYSPSSNLKNMTEYLNKYPGDDIIDVVGFDTYQLKSRDQYLEKMERSLCVVDSVSRVHHKVMAITETGYETIPDAKWWTETLLPAIGDYPIAYVLVWRNARDRENHFYAPYPGQVSADNFVEFYNHPRTLFVEGINLYD